jgi:hypothetical protein
MRHDSRDVVERAPPPPAGSTRSSCPRGPWTSGGGPQEVSQRGWWWGVFWFCSPIRKADQKKLINKIQLEELIARCSAALFY